MKNESKIPDFLTGLKRLLRLELSPEIHNVVQSLLKNSDWSEESFVKAIKTLSYQITDFNNTISVFHCLPQLRTDIVLSAIENEKDHRVKYILLSKLFQIQKDSVQGFLVHFDPEKPPWDNESRTFKKQKLDYKVTELDIVECCWILLRTSFVHFKDKWNWAEFLKLYLYHQDHRLVWIACQCASKLLGTELIVTKYLTDEENRNYSFMYSKILFNDDYLFDDHVGSEYDKDEKFNSISSGFSSQTVNVGGISLPVLNPQNQDKEGCLISVQSTCNNLRNVALGISTSKAICLFGAVGSGKTALVEHLAKITGREINKELFKVQLGEETDAKLLLGTYRCTDLPGEFIWESGVLTKAILGGHWLLIEDIESASSDIAALLAGLLENGVVNIPGFRDNVQVAPGFQLFMTHRLFPGLHSNHKKHTGATELIEKYWLQVNVEPLAFEELVHVIQTKFAPLKTIAERMVKVFSMFTINDSNETNEIISRQIGRRHISVRDLIKWCARAKIDFDVSSQESALKVLQDAIDLFCCSYRDPAIRLQLASNVAACLGIIKTKAEYFCTLYKPNVTLTDSKCISGRAVLERINSVDSVTISKMSESLKFAFTRESSCLVERIGVCLSLNEPVLLVGETGTGKTSTIQLLAQRTGHKLVVINMNQQSDSSDLLGGYKPVDIKHIIMPLRDEFERLFRSLFNVKENLKFLENISVCISKRMWLTLLKLMSHSHGAALRRLMGTKDEATLLKWKDLGDKIFRLKSQLERNKSIMAFSFIEGSLVKALKKGHWVLLDEINLASAETLQCLSGLLEGTSGSVSLLERGDNVEVERSPNFRLLAAMNPATDFGKKDLPLGIRNRFTELFVSEHTERSDLSLLVQCYLPNLPTSKIDSVVQFYLSVKKKAADILSDSIGQKPLYSLRTLCRGLMIAAENKCGSAKRSLYEALCLSFLTQLNSKSHDIVKRMIAEGVMDKSDSKSILSQPIPEPVSGKHIRFEGYWVPKGPLKAKIPEKYLLTTSVRKNLCDIARCVSLSNHPILIQGETSVGKTSLITYLAESSGHKCFRINNHQHTDLQEYVGSYSADTSGNLVFKEGVLVEAMRHGHWIILDELNLAPSEVLEALNRVLDDNRELFIPETQATVKAHENFRLFATQNPPGLYGGRKMLSRAFRNRFVELHFDEIPPPELISILQHRCDMPESYAKKLVAVMSDLQTRRKGSAAFAGKQGFITLRDLFRWGERYRLANDNEKHKYYDWDQHIADEGFLVLAGRVRKEEESDIIRIVIEKHIKRTVSLENLFTLNDQTSSVTKHILERILLFPAQDDFKHIVWTYNLRKLAVLVGKALEFCEPILLVGETGCGKTSICQFLTAINEQKLYCLNCHQNSESSDFLGGLRPVRDNVDKSKLFEWYDGPLIDAMRGGHVFLADEISLADDSVLERLNSLLEPERKLLVSEKGFGDEIEITAEAKFRFIGTMNPGGDFGKKELSPALRNRLTEIWCDPPKSDQDLISIVEHNLSQGLSLSNQQDGSSGIGKIMVQFINWFKSTEIGKRISISVRDVLTWVNFINLVSTQERGIEVAYIHGAYLTFLDGIGTANTAMENTDLLQEFKSSCEDFLFKQVQIDSASFYSNNVISETESSFGISPFFINKGHHSSPKDTKFLFDAPTTCLNTLRLLRSLQIPSRAILLEGSPGVGKTSVVMALAKATGNEVTRINLSEQTDISDLFGADLPVEGAPGGTFAWRDGPFLKALKEGQWILLDELNLASQSVVEGLNSVLDHRGEVFIPELNKTFKINKETTRLFGCQNPQRQGGARKGLPQSFLNRFTQVFMQSLTKKDFQIILRGLYPKIPISLIEKIVSFNVQLNQKTKLEWNFHHGPWEWNLRDLVYWMETVENDNPGTFVTTIMIDRLRNKEDRIKVINLYKEIFEPKYPLCEKTPPVVLTEDQVIFGEVVLERNHQSKRSGRFIVDKNNEMLILRNQLSVLRSLALCVKMGWLSILVGESYSGKSCSVYTLAHLLGRKVYTIPISSATDTTELLGGFEQTDYGRHLDSISQEVENLVILTARKYVLAKNFDLGEKLLDIWYKYVRSSKISDLQELTLVKALANFNSRIDKISEIVGHLPPELSKSLNSKLTKLRKNVDTNGLKAGGTFEWVDSVLTKCLVEGHWLIVDNVNLCSGAVLDRLNSLLERDGVLILSERGIGPKGEFIIKPHPNFRLFFTMDPKNGQISRAMRNRGIEIYVESPSVSTLHPLDLDTLLNSLGLKSHNYKKAVIHIHSKISENSLGFEKPNINHLITAMFLAVQNWNRGASLCSSIQNAFNEIYIKSRTLTKEHTLVQSETLKEAMAEVRFVLKDTGSNTADCFRPEMKTLSTLNVQENVILTSVKQQGSLLFSFLKLLETVTKSNLMSKNFSSYILSDLVGFSLNTVDNFVYDLGYRILDTLPFIIISFYNLSSHYDVEYRHRWLVNVIDSMPKTPMTKNIFDKIIHISNIVVNVLKSQLKDSKLPYDTRQYSRKENAKRWSDENKTNILVCCQVILACNFTDGELKTKKINWRSLTILQYSNAIKKGILSKLPTDLLLICEIDTFFSEFDRLFKTIFTSKYTVLSTEQACQWLYCIAWKFRFASCASRRLFSGKENSATNIPPISEDSVMLLILHYKWFRKHTLPLLLEMVQQHPTLEKSAQPLLKLIDRFDASIEIGKIHLVPLTRKFTRLTKPPLPLRSTDQCDSNKKLHLFHNVLEFWKPDVHNVESFKNNVNFIASPEGKAIRNKMIRCSQSVHQDNIQPLAEEMFFEVETSLTCRDTENRSTGLEELASIKLWPLQELICLQLNIKLRNSLDSHEFKLFSSSLTNWFTNISSTCPISAGIVKDILTNYDVNEKKENGLLLLLLMRQMNNAISVRNPTLCLKWEEYCDSDDLEAFNNKDFYTLNLPLYSLFLSNLISTLSSNSLTFALRSHKITSKMVTNMKTLLWRNLPAIFSNTLDTEKNDVECLKKYYHFFIIQLRKSLLNEETTEKDFQDPKMTDILMANLMKLSSFDPDNLKGIPKTSKGQTKLITSIIQCFKSLIDLMAEIDRSERSSRINLLTGKGWALVGLIQLLLFSNLETVDPVQKQSLKRQYAIEETIELKMYLCIEALNKVIVGDTNDWPFKESHTARIEYLEKKSQDLNKLVAVRPCPSLYHNIVMDVKTLIDYLTSPGKFLPVLDQFGAANTKNKDKEQIVAAAKTWLLSIRAFNEKLYRDYFSTYPDIVTAPLLASSQIIYGMDLAICNTVKDTLKQEINMSLSIQECLRRLSSFPIQDVDAVVDIIKICNSADILNIMEKFSDYFPKYEGLNFKLKLAKICVRLVKCLSKTKQVKNVYGDFIKVLDFVVHSWQKLQEDVKIKNLQEQSIYINKMTPIQIEEEETRKSIAEMFPSHRDQDFGDLDGPKSLEDNPEVYKKEEKSDQTIHDLQDINDIYSLHSLIVSTTKSSHFVIKDKESDESNDQQLLSERMKIFINLINPLYLGCDKELDRYAIPGLIVMANSPIDTTEYKIHKNYNFYKDSNVEEAKQCISLMNAILKRVESLLEEWSDHPTLNQIKIVVERVVGFEMTSPLSRFLTGLELLLGKLHDWEENAHEKVSLASHAASLTHQIIEWRKLELSAWKGALDSVLIKIQEESCKWWFHLYSSLTSFIESDQSTEDFVNSLQFFMEKSPLGEYSSRLKLLLTFHLHSLILPSSDRQKSASNIFWNLYKFYRLFEDSVAKKIREISTPIEKKLKEFVKIARWNDINYWSVKAAIEKTHSTIFKHVKEFEKLLKDPASVAMVKISEHNLKIPKLLSKNYITEIELLDTYEDKESERILDKLQFYVRKSKKVVEKCIETNPYTKLLEDLSYYVSCLVETEKLIEEFNLDVPQEKKKKAAKSLLQQKRKAVSDLFRTLTQLGLTYRSGLLMYESKNVDFAIRNPMDLKSSLEQIDARKGDRDLISSWTNTEELFLNSVAQCAQLKIVLEKPHKDLGPQVTERIKGFSSHFSKLLQDVKNSLGLNSEKFFILRCQLAQLKDVDSENLGSVNSTLDNFKIELTSIFDDILICLPQFLMLLNACPEQQNAESLIFESHFSNKMVNAYKFDEEWEETKFKIKTTITSSSRLKDKLAKYERNSNFSKDFPKSGVDVITSKSFLDFIDGCFEKLNEICSDLIQIQDSFGLNLSNEVCTNPLVDSLENLTFKIKFLIQEYNEKRNFKPVKSPKTQVFQSKLESLAHKTLIVLQNIYKNDRIENSDDYLIDGHIKEKIVENILSDVEKLSLMELTDGIAEIFNVLPSLDDAQIAESQMMLRNCLPLFDQFISIAQYFITQETICLKVLSSLQSTLLSIFIKFGRNGYNVPEELIEDGEEGESEETKGGMGLGDGEGEKDVSDQIENQDQLEDAKKPGEHGQDEDKDCKEEEKGINMDDDIGGHLQDVEKKEGEEGEEDDDKEDHDKEMGETEKGAETLDKEVWGSDSEEEEDEAKPKDEEGDRGSEETQKELAAKDDSDQKEPNEEKKDGKREEKKDEVNEMDENGIDEDHIDPYHANMPPSPEVEPLDLGDDEMEVDDDISQKSDDETENPFDIDQMKEKIPEIEEEKEEKGEESKTEENEEGGEENFEKPHLKQDEEEAEEKEDEDEGKPDKGEVEEKEEVQENVEENVEEPMEADKPSEAVAEPSQQKESSKDQVCGEQEDSESANLEPMEASGKEKSGSGNAEKATKDDGGHSGQQGMKKNDGTKEKEEKRHRPGESEIERSLGDVNEPVKKKMKTMGVQDKTEEEDTEAIEHSEDADLYQHIHESKETSYDAQVIDTATQDQAEKKPVPDNQGEKEEEETMDMHEDVPEEEIQVDKLPSEKIGDKQKEKKESKKGDGEAVEDASVQVEGDIIPTANVPRGSESSYHTRLEELNVESLISESHIQSLRQELVNQLASWSQPPAGPDAVSAWEKLCTVTSSLARDLSEQLRLILEPTTASGLKGDFRTGRRINMRKVIPYIASEFRKDKIWLRRSKPSKREYQIILAVDDSSSMSDNHSKELAFESVALVSRALSLLEAGDLAVLSFGDTIKVLHKLGDPFTEHSGAGLLQQFSFDQKRTKIGALVDHAVSLLSTSSRQTDADLAQLLLIVSDGRGVMSEGEASVIASVRRAKLQNVFMVFVIIDNPESRDSILDIRLPCFKDGKLLGITSYMDSFPFPFYLILRDINNLPSVLSDALRQWFELVTNTRSGT